jgi:hypothetical protein
MPGPQVGTGSAEPVADRWLAIICEEEEEENEAAAPARTTTNAKIRRASFIFSYPLEKFC